MKKRASSLLAPHNADTATSFFDLYDKESPHHLNLKEFLILEWILEKEYGFPATLSRLSKIPRTEIYNLCQGLVQKKWLQQQEIHKKKCYQLLHYKQNIQELTKLLQIHQEHLKSNLHKYENKIPAPAQNLHSPLQPLISYESALQILIDHHIPNLVSGVFKSEQGMVQVQSISSNELGLWIQSKVQDKFHELKTPSTNPENKIGLGVHTKKVQYSQKLEDFTTPTITKSFSQKIQSLAKAKHIYFIPFTEEQETQAGGVLLLFEQKKSKGELTHLKSVLKHLHELNRLKFPLTT